LELFDPPLAFLRLHQPPGMPEDDVGLKCGGEDLLIRCYDFFCVVTCFSLAQVRVIRYFSIRGEQPLDQTWRR